MTTTAKEAAAAIDPIVEPYVESGEAFRRLGGLESPAVRERYDVVVIGGGQAGLSVGYYLRKRGLRFLILDASERIGDVWRKRWDSLRLFTPAKFDGLAGMKFPGARELLPDEGRDGRLPRELRGTLPAAGPDEQPRRPATRRDGAFVVKAGDLEVEADQVVVAMANYQTPPRPRLRARASRRLVQVLSDDYRNPSQLRDGPVLIVGAGNSGAEIAKELAGTHESGCPAAARARRRSAWTVSSPVRSSRASCCAWCSIAC